MKICIIGAGITGLSSAYKLSTLGHEVKIFESNSFSGGQASTVKIDDFEIEKAYHHLFVTDKSILKLYKDLGIQDELEWFKSSVATYSNNKIWPTTTPVDLLSLPIISFKERIKLSFISVRLKFINNWKKFENITAYDWLSNQVSENTFKIIFEPLLRGKFGKYYKQICMPWFWAKIQSRVSSRNKMFQEILCYPKSSFSFLIKSLENKIIENGGYIYHNHIVTKVNVNNNKIKAIEYINDNKIKATENFDIVISTTPYSILSKLVPFDKEILTDMKKVDYMSAIVVILILKNPISKYYWLSIADNEFPFLGIIEHTNLIPKERYGGSNIIYITNYVEANNDLLTLDYKSLMKIYLPFLKKINTDFNMEYIEDYKFNKINYAQPIIPINYSSYKIPIKLPIKGLYSANTAQIYPEDRGTNYSVKLSETVTKLIQEDENGFT
jgi:protoporphyrinogen oxidase|tara:strand:+ start:17648 stop:18970 length:1323 start_codon:yes stop_codon:yes gene_type:complete